MPNNKEWLNKLQFLNTMKEAADISSTSPSSLRGSNYMYITDHLSYAITHGNSVLFLRVF